MEKGKKTGAIRKEEGAKAPDSPEAKKAGAAVADKAAGETPVLSESDKKAKKAANDKASKIKREKEKAAAELIEKEVEAKRGYFIEDGKSISSAKGILGPGDRVKPEYFGKDGAAVLKRLVDSGAVKEVK